MDAIKALAMFLVIWGHCILHLSSWNKNDDIVFVVINTFHVSLFMMVAGYFSTSSLSLGLGKMLLNKTKQLIIPCLLWGGIITLLCAYYNHDTSKTIAYFLDCLWFLKSLFLCYILAFVALRLGTVPTVLVILASMVMTIFKMNVMFPAFMLGIYIKKKENAGVEIGKQWVLWLTLSVFVFMAYFYDGHYFNSPNRIMGIIKEGSLSTWLAYFGKTAYRILIGNFGALSVFLIFRGLFKSMDNNIICKIGRETLGIYILQAVLLETILKQYITFYGNHAVMDFVIAPILSLIMMVLCYSITMVLSKNKITGQLLLGKYPKNTDRK
jgi:fucose 4-O-acetylase-like acetyltransferase